MRKTTKQKRKRGFESRFVAAEKKHKATARYAEFDAAMEANGYVHIFNPDDPRKDLCVFSKEHYRLQDVNDTWFAAIRK